MIERVVRSGRDNRDQSDPSARPAQIDAAPQRRAHAMNTLYQ
jgi:hypothetical protein